MSHNDNVCVYDMHSFVNTRLPFGERENLSVISVGRREECEDKIVCMLISLNMNMCIECCTKPVILAYYNPLVVS